MSETNAVAIVGIGELGGVFARGLLRTGHPVFPVTRAITAQHVSAQLPDPAHVLVTVGEATLSPVVSSLPPAWRQNLGLVQNELLPRDWGTWGKEPTVAVVWFEKKPGRPVHAVLPTEIAGPQAGLLSSALESIGIDSSVIESGDPLLYSLVQKNVYILTTNIAGVAVGGTVRELWDNHRELAMRTARDAIALQAALTGRALDEDLLIAHFEKAIDADPNHNCAGRSAPQRLARALAHAQKLGVATLEFEKIATMRKAENP
jgi:hypothetical protein